jgi:tetratricopeptide (TPR) repeat protein
MNDLRNQLSDWLGTLRERLPSDVNLALLLPIGVMVMAALGNLIFVRSAIMPHWQAREELAAQLTEVEQQLLEAQRAQEKDPEELREELKTAQDELNQTAQFFFSESQAAEILDRLYQYAGESDVEIVNLQSLSGPAEVPPGEEQPTEESAEEAEETKETGQEEQKKLYDVNTFQLEVAGSVPHLLAFLSRIKEASFKTFKVDNVNIVEDADTGHTSAEFQHTLTMTITLYTSPYSTGTAGETPPDILPTVTPMDLTQLEDALTAVWEEQDWDQAIYLINQILAIDPNYDDMVEKLYQAHVNYGYQLIEQGNNSEAIAQFNQALEIKPGGEEATAGLQQASATPTPTLTAKQQLEQRLDQAWAAEDWEGAIDLVGQILALDPADAAATEKLYAAHVNYGYRLVAQGKLDQAKQEFSHALTIKPDGSEALAGLEQLAAGTPTPTPRSGPQYIMYVVRQGDTLFSIAQRYGVSVQTIMEANGLTGYELSAGQQLRIPVP